MKFKTLFTVFVLLMVPLASGKLQVNKKTNNFAVHTSSLDKKVCSCGTTTFPVTIDNVGDMEAVFKIEVVSKQDWFTVEQRSFNLKSGESATTNVQANLPCGWQGTADLTIKITSTYGREKRIDRTLNVVKCENLEVTKKVGSQVKDPSEKATFSFRVENTGTFTEDYGIKVGDYKDFVTLSESNLELEPGQSQTIYAYARFPASKWGEFDIPVTVRSKKNKLERKVNLNLRINRAYDFALETTSKAATCTKVNEKLPVKIKNRADVKNTYDVELSGPGFAKLSSNKVSLVPGGEKTLHIEMSARDRNEGQHTLKLKATSTKGKIEKEKEILLDVNNCYDHEVSMEASAQKICGPQSFDVKVSNNGLKRETFRLNSSLGTIKNRITIGAAETKTVSLQTELPCANGNYKATVVAENADQPRFKEKATMNLQVFTRRKAHQLALSQTNFKVEHDAEELSIPITNEGIEGGKYEVSLDSDFLSLKNDEIEIWKGETRELTMLANLSAISEGEHLHDLAFTLKGTNITYTTTIGTNVQGPSPLIVFGKFVYKSAKFIGWKGLSTFVLLAALAALIIVGIMIDQGKIEVERFTTDYREHFRVLNFALLLVAILGIVFFFGSFSLQKGELYEAPKVNQSATFHQFKQGGSYKLDLEQYFEDPDDDRLVYDYKNAENIDVSIKGSMARLSSDWSGEEQVVFTATDEGGATEESPPMTVHVRERTGDTFVEIWIANVVEVNALIITLIFLALFWLADKVEPRGREYYFGN